MRLELGHQQLKSQTKDLWQIGVLPILALGSLAGLLGVYWDIAWHIDIGRDSFFTLPHNFIYGFMTIVLGMSLYGLIRDQRDTFFHLKVGKIQLHSGVLLVAVGAMLVLFFAPADDLWHRLFGPDITLWGPMHLVGLLGFTTATFGGLVSSWLEYSITASRKFLWTTLLFAAILLGWSMLFLAEYEYNVPAFPIFWHILLLTALPTFTLILISKLEAVKYAATVTTVLFTLIRLGLAGWLTVTKGQNLAGDSQPVIPFLVLAGLLTDFLVQRNTPLWLTGLCIGTITFLSNIPLALWQNLSWHTQALQVGIPFGLLLSMLLGYLGNTVAEALTARKTL